MDVYKLDLQTQNRNTGWQSICNCQSCMYQNHREVEVKWENKENTKPFEEDCNIPSLSLYSWSQWHFVLSRSVRHSEQSIMIAKTMASCSEYKYNT